MLAFLSSVSATIFVIEPVDTKLSDGGEVFFGQMARGETFRVIINKKNDLGAPWNALEVNVDTLPKGWSVSTKETDKTLIAEITAPKDAIVSTQRFKFTLSNNTQPPFFAESFYGSVAVRENLLAVTIENLQQRTVVGSRVQFKLNLNNDSIAPHTVLVQSSLPSYWFKPMVVELQPKEVKSLQLYVDVFSYGERPFSFLVSSEKNASSFYFPGKLTIKPSLKGKFSAPFFGLPFVAPGLLPDYLINSFLSLLS